MIDPVNRTDEPIVVLFRVQKEDAMEVCQLVTEHDAFSLFYKGSIPS